MAEADELMKVARGVLQLQDMADVNRNCISASALCFEPHPTLSYSAQNTC
ncbi:hypothetical protein [Paracoccus marcusii]|nr:hypothetical protein [Paracoccus marcusii]